MDEENKCLKKVRAVLLVIGIIVTLMMMIYETVVSTVDFVKINELVRYLIN